MRRVNFAALALAGVMAVGTGSAQAACKLQQIAELPVIIEHGQPRVEVSIDGHPVHFLLDTGASTTLLTRTGAAQLGLQLQQMSGVKFYGVGGSSQADEARVKDLQLGEMVAHDIDMLVLDRPLPGGVAGILGRDVLMQHDLEIDLAHKVMRMIASNGCDGDQVVYWSNSYLDADIEKEMDEIVVNATLNDKHTTALLDTGASTSVVTLDGARAAGVTPEAVDVKKDGKAVGIGGAVDVWVGTFKTLGVGSEVVQNARLKLSDLYSKGDEVLTGSHIRMAVVDSPDMILGDDFIKAHHIYIATKQGKMYFTYNGGGIFEAPQTAADAPAKPADTPAK